MFDDVTRRMCEPYLTELLLQLLIGIVDTELFEAVHFERLKTVAERKAIDFPYVTFKYWAQRHP